MRPVRIGAPRGAQTLHPARVAHKRCCTLAAAILLAVRPASGVGPTVSPPGPLDQLKAGDGCIRLKDGSICPVAEERLEGFEALPPGRGRYLLAGGTKLASSPGAEGPKLGDAARSGASSLVLPGQPNHKVFQPGKSAPGKDKRAALEFRCQCFRHLEKVLHHSMSVALARGDDDMGFADYFSEIRRITTHARPNELAWDV